MELFLHCLYLLIGVVALYFGADWLVGGSSRLAVRLGISPLVVGLTVVAFGTSSPELFVCLNLNFNGHPDMAAANVVGSNICNIALILGISALLRPLIVRSELLLRDLPILIGINLLFVWMMWDGQFTRLDGGILILGIVAYTAISFLTSKREKDPVVLQEFETEFGEKAKNPGKVWQMLSLILIGLGALAVGARFLETGAVYIARVFSVPEAIISLTVIAIGTSLPELATSIVASLKREGDIITGNAIGSSIFNLCFVIGATAMAKPMKVTEIQNMDLGFMVGTAVLVTPLMWTRRRLSQVEGLGLLLVYVVYCVLLWQRVRIG